MRRSLLLLPLTFAVALLAGCGNKGPLYSPPPAAAHPVPAPAHAATAQTPASASSVQTKPLNGQ